jgi:hypothetical protein
MQLPPDFDFRTLSVEDLLEARDQHQAALSNMQNVVATAIGKFRRRLGDSAATTWHRRHGRPPRTLLNSEVTDDSFPCVLVFVEGWIDLKEFEQTRRPVAAQTAPRQNVRHLVPQLLYLPDGRSVPTCVVMVDWEDRPPESLPWTDVHFPSNLLGGGFGVVTTVQGVDHVGTVACLVTDGEQLYALTARHVAGSGGQAVNTRCRGEAVLVGQSAGRDLPPVPFSEVYPGWPGDRTISVQDSGLIRLERVERWSSQLFGIGELANPADLNTTNISLDLIGAPVRSYGARSHDLMVGEICGLFPRFKSMGGVDYVADLLIGPRDRNADALKVQPGDSGSLWVDDSPEAGTRRKPVAVNWGALDLEGGRNTYYLALASFVSQVCRRLNVEVVTGHNIGYHPVWGKPNHALLATAAAGLLPPDDPLYQFLWADGDRKPALETLSGVPDDWKRAPYSRGSEGPNHYASVDFSLANPGLLSDVALDPEAWMEFYLKHPVAKGDWKKRGALPFRIWQVFDDLLAMAGDASNDVPERARRFCCGCGLLAHYVADACNPAHVTQWGLGHPDWTNPRKGSDFHHVWDSPPLTDEQVGERIGSWSPPSIADGAGAGRQALDLMLETLDAVKLGPFVRNRADDPTGAIDAADAYVQGDGGMEAMAERAGRGCALLRALWRSAWAAVEAEGLADRFIAELHVQDLQSIYEEDLFLESVTIQHLAVVNGKLELHAH